MYNSSAELQTDNNMKILLFVAICAAVAVAKPVDKQKRDILPGDPRYGQEHHHGHLHEHNHNEHEVEIAKSFGGYVNTYTVPQAKYGPPNFQPSAPINNGDYQATVVENKITEPVNTFTQVTSNEIPVVKDVTKHYLPPATAEVKKVVTTYERPVETTIVRKEFTTPTLKTSYGTAVVDVKTTEGSHVPHTSYELPSASTAVPLDVVRHHDDSRDTAVVHTTIEKTVVPEVKVHDNFGHGHVEEIHETKTFATPTVKTEVIVPEHKTVEHGHPIGPIEAPVTSIRSHYDTHHDFNSGLGYDSSFLTSHSFPSSFPSTVHELPSTYNFPTSHINTYGLPLGTSGYGNLHSLPISSPSQYPLVQTLSNPYLRVPQPVYGVPQTYVFPGHVGHIQRENPFANFFQETFPNLQFPSFQVPSFENIFKPTVPTAPFPIPDVTEEVTKKVTSNESVVVKHPVTKTTLVETPVTKTSTKTITIGGAPVTKTTSTTTKVKEYTQPLAENGGYVY